MAKRVRRSPVPVYSIAVLWVIWVLLFPLYKPAHFIILGLCSVILYYFVRVFDKGELVEEKRPSTGNAELDTMMDQRDEAIAEMRRLNDNIEDEYISLKIDEIEASTQKIFDVVLENPQKAGSVRKFMNYYLPTTLKMLDAYDKMTEVGIDGANINATKDKIEGIMDTVAAAFNKQLDGLYGDEALDISTDITVLENMLAREGLTDQQLKSQN